jgi:hypothetical protein
LSRATHLKCFSFTYISWSKQTVNEIATWHAVQIGGHAAGFNVFLAENNGILIQFVEFILNLVIFNDISNELYEPSGKCTDSLSTRIDFPLSSALFLFSVSKYSPIADQCREGKVLRASAFSYFKTK